MKYFKVTYTSTKDCAKHTAVSEGETEEDALDKFLMEHWECDEDEEIRIKEL